VVTNDRERDDLWVIARHRTQSGDSAKRAARIRRSRRPPTRATRSALVQAGRREQGSACGLLAPAWDNVARARGAAAMSVNPGRPSPSRIGRRRSRLAPRNRCLTRLNVRRSRTVGSPRFAPLRASAHPGRWHFGCSVLSAWSGHRGRVALHAIARVCHTTCLVVPPSRAGRFILNRL
jgi:hypothetical protein